MKSKIHKNVVFFGSSEFSIIILEGIYRELNIEFIVVKNFESEINKIAKKLNIKTVLFSEITLDLFEKIDFAVVASFGALIKEDFLNTCDFINVHPSYLPQLRGATPIQSTILQGLDKTGISIIKMNKGMDEGDILFQKKISIKDNLNYKELETKLAIDSIEPLIYCISNFSDITPIIQDSTLSSYCYVSDFSRDKIKISWNRNADYIERLIRAAYPAWCTFNGMNININKATVVNIKSEKPSYIFRESKDLLVGCKDFYLNIESIQKEGGKYITGREFKNGISNINIFKFD
jgi:methionyl-tRNA formyltransferase